MLERAYDLSGSESEWLRELAEGILQNCNFVTSGALIFELPRVVPAPSEPATVGLSEADHRKYLRAAAMLDDCLRLMPNGQHESLFTATGCRTISALGTPEDPMERAAWEQLLTLWSPRDVLGIVGKNPDGTGVVFAAILQQPTVLTPWYARHWTRMATHLAAALRLRRALAEADSSDLGGEAVVEPSNGRLQHAIGPARSAGARAALQRAVRAIDKARGSLRRDDPISAVELWRGLVAGRWSLVDRCDSDGRRYYVAHKNEPQALELRALSERERQVVGYAVQGHPNKLIAYELGLDTSTVSNYLRAARSKLGVRSRTELVRVAWLLSQGSSTDGK